jgi:hypothetical protein
MVSRRGGRAKRRVVAISVGGLALAGSVALAPVAWAQPAMSVDVTSASVQAVASSPSACVWTVSATVQALDLSGGPLTLSSVHPRVSWRAPGGASGVVPAQAVQVVANGGLTAGATLPAASASAPGPVVTWSGYEVQAPMPCDVTSADLSVVISAGGGTWSGDAPFVVGSVTTPLGAMGALTTSGLLAVVALAFWRRSGRRRVRPLSAPEAVGHG